MKSEKIISMSRIIKDTNVHQQLTQSIPVGDADCDGTSQSRLSVVKNGEVIQQIEVVCACGTITRIDCQYE